MTIASSDLERIYVEWQNNANFRQKFSEDPARALEEAGFAINKEDIAKLRRILHDENQALDHRWNE